MALFKSMSLDILNISKYSWLRAAAPTPMDTSCRSGLSVETRDPAFKSGFGRRVKLEHQRIVPRDAMARGCRQFLQGLVALDHFLDIVSQWEHPPAIDVRVKMAGVGGEDQKTTPGFEAPRL